MTATDSLDPLADYLEPRFGNIHKGNGFMVRQEWTDELQQAVRHYVVDVAAEELYRETLGWVMIGGDLSFCRMIGCKRRR